jgi:hypothetical protein
MCIIDILQINKSMKKNEIEEKMEQYHSTKVVGQKKGLQ